MLCKSPEQSEFTIALMGTFLSLLGSCRKISVKTYSYKRSASLVRRITPALISLMLLYIYLINFHPSLETFKSRHLSFIKFPQYFAHLDHSLVRQLLIYTSPYVICNTFYSYYILFIFICSGITGMEVSHR